MTAILFPTETHNSTLRYDHCSLHIAAKAQSLESGSNSAPCPAPCPLPCPLEEFGLIEEMFISGLSERKSATQQTE